MQEVVRWKESGTAPRLTVQPVTHLPRPLLEKWFPRAKWEGDLGTGPCAQEGGRSKGVLGRRVQGRGRALRAQQARAAHPPPDPRCDHGCPRTVAAGGEHLGLGAPAALNPARSCQSCRLCRPGIFSALGFRPLTLSLPQLCSLLSLSNPPSCLSRLFLDFGLSAVFAPL